MFDDWSEQENDGCRSKPCPSLHMQIYLDKLSATIGVDEHLVLVLDQTGWHGANHLKMPPN